MALLDAVVNHLVLPPKVPGKQEPDADLDAVSYDILLRMINACKKVASFANVPSCEAFQTLRTSLEACRALNFDYLDKNTLLEHFRALEADHTLTLILHVVKQNAAILMRREDRLVHGLQSYYFHFPLWISSGFFFLGKDHFAYNRM